MTEFIWHWTKGNKKIYTTQIDLAEQAMKEGFFIMGARVNPIPSQQCESLTIKSIKYFFFFFLICGRFLLLFSI